VTEPAAPSRIPWPPILYVAAVIVAIVLGVAYPLPWIGEPLAGLLFAVGWILAVAAIGIFAAAVRTLSRARTTVMPTRASEHLVISGPFAFTRNPIYLANTTLVIAIGLIVGSVWFPVLAVVAAIATTQLAIKGEERHLAARFGKKYRDYAARVRRWL
jgi:protein-S-isoprenylcysteine O-methyltransferase Ste14